ncbi:uncharacterized protein KQ657_000538 [Scheffersomyces spartinae]|uniref:Agglutinin-like protein N-terminal domain-containing protein n=1 Tax=Scheffersomyces spartinae TaxID=45513 RepID=A0A9P8AIT7_9ASCO|nr:uncharacterized protein KQ657_000538 [Scheffersomyces spartinae]KAG7193471.1 hypothetical protein KQ657_000538 [Scheffersomyces spartinae]
MITIFLEILSFFAFVCQFINAAAISGIFQTIDQIRYDPGAFYYAELPSNPNWDVELSWSINGSTMNAGDTYQLTLPCIFKITADVDSFDLVANLQVLANCIFHSGELLVSYSTVTCQLTKAVNSDTMAVGKTSFPITFNVGGGNYDVMRTCATYFEKGTNTLEWTDGTNTLSYDIDFQGGFAYGYDTDSIIYSLKEVPTISRSLLYLMAGNCPNGYLSGTLGVTVTNGKLECSSFHQGLTDYINVWFNNEDYEQSSFDFTCDGNALTVNYSNIKGKGRPFLNILVVFTGGDFLTSFTNDYYCSGSDLINSNSFIKNWGTYQNGLVQAEGIAFTTITTTVDHVTVTTEKGVSETTYIVLVPMSSTTTTTTWTNEYTSETTDTGTQGTETIIVQVPYSLTTFTTTWANSYVSTTTVTGEDGTATVIVELPTPITTKTTTWSNSYVSTTTTTGEDGTATVIVELPTPITTKTTTWSNTYYGNDA